MSIFDSHCHPQMAQYDKDREEMITRAKRAGVRMICEGTDLERSRQAIELANKQERQKEVFGQFLDLAIQYNKPVIIHSRDAVKGTTGRVHEDLLNILNTKYLIHNTRLHGVAHSFTGSMEDAKKYLELGFYLGFNGIITFTHQYDEIVREVPLERIILETDAPYLTPEPYRGKRNEPI